MYTIPNLTNGEPVRVTPAEPPLEAPGMVTGLMLEPGDSTVTASWAAQADSTGGGAVGAGHG